MIDPIQKGVNLYLAVFNSLPQPFRAFIFLLLGLLIISIIVRLIFN